MILTQKYNLPKGTNLNNTVLSNFINTFWADTLSSHSANKHFLILCKVIFINNETRTLANMRKVNFSDKDLFIDYLIGRLGIINDNYKNTPVSAISFDYSVRDGLAEGDRALLKSEEYTPSQHNYNNMNLPRSMNPLDFGILLA